MVLIRIIGTTVVNKLGYHLSRIAVAIADRGKFVAYCFRAGIWYYPNRYLIYRYWPNADPRIQWVKAQWDSELHLCLTDPFPVPLEVFGADTDSWAHREVRAFREGEHAVRQFFGSQGNPYDEATRRSVTPRLLDVDPSSFTILVRVMQGGRLSVRDGAHRIALAQLAGREEIRVQVLAEWSLEVRGNWDRALLRWFFIPFEDLSSGIKN